MVNGDVPPQLHNLTDLMQLFVMAFSPLSSGPVISGQASSLQQGRTQHWSKSIGRAFDFHERAHKNTTGTAK